MSKMDESAIYDKMTHFLISLVVKFCKKSTMRELPTILCVSHMGNVTDKTLNTSQSSLSSMINDEKIVTCIRKGLSFLKTFFKQMQTSDGGIPVSGGSIESWRVNNIEIDILSYDAKLFKCDEFEIEQVESKLSDGTVSVKTLWPMAYLAESYILGGVIDKKKVAGSGRFKITVTNFSASLDLKLQENEANLEIKDLKFDADFENVEVTISGLEVEGNENPETLMNNAIQRDKQKFKEMLQSNTSFLSKQALVVMNLQLKRTDKKTVVDTSLMKFVPLCFVALLSLRKVFSLLKVLDDLQASCAGLICDYSFIAWKEKIEILQANNELRNFIADGYTADITTAAINKLAWSEKLGALAQDQANLCPGSKIWTFTEKNGHCEFASAKRVRKYAQLHKNFSSFVNENRMMDLEEDLFDRTKKKLRRASAYSIGCGYVLRYYKDKLIDHFVCLYCYVNNKHDYISLNANRSCQQDCLHENFTCDRLYYNLCSYKSKDGNIDARHKTNIFCPKINLLTGSVLFWNFLSNNVVCLLATVFISTSIICSVLLAVYFSVKNYDSWKKYFEGKDVINVEPEVLSNVEILARPESGSTPPPTMAAPQAPIAAAPDRVQSWEASRADKLNAYTLPSQPPQVHHSQFFSQHKLPQTEKSREKWAECSQNDEKSNKIAKAGAATSSHKMNKTAAKSATRRIGARKMVAQGASKIPRGVGGSKSDSVSDPFYGQHSSGNPNKRPKMGTSKLQRPKDQPLGRGSRYL